jgi:translation initiation factor RLI1
MPLLESGSFLVVGHRYPFAKRDLICRPQGLVSGFNKFLNTLDITFRRDPTN